MYKANRVCGRSLTGIVRSSPAGVWMSVSCECGVLSGRGLLVGLITCPEKSYRVWDVQCVWSRSCIWGGHETAWGWSATVGGGGDVLRPIQTRNYKVWAEYWIFECWTCCYVYLQLDIKPLIRGRLFVCSVCKNCSWRLRVPWRLPTGNSKWMSNKPLPYCLAVRYTVLLITWRSSQLLYITGNNPKFSERHFVSYNLFIPWAPRALVQAFRSVF